MHGFRDDIRVFPLRIRVREPLKKIVRNETSPLTYVYENRAYSNGGACILFSILLYSSKPNSKKWGV